MFKILDGRTELWQWDLDVKLVVSDPTITEVHFCNRTDDCALVVEVQNFNGQRIANIPNIILQDSWPIRAYAYCGENHTVVEQLFEVNRRNRPADYVYTETEIKTWETLEASINAAIDKAGYYVPVIQEEDGTLSWIPSRPSMPAAGTYTVRGAKGEQGDIGPVGPRGPQGPKGDVGASFTYDMFTSAQLEALRGPQGLVGPRGVEGPQGPQGVQGPAGPQGPKGSKGDAFTYDMFTPEQLAALTGPEGPQGPRGAMGPQGPQGPQGLQGEQGPMGMQGAKGNQGERGEQGPEGPRGPQGAKGETGPQGEQGERGPVGPQGPEGPQGPRGYQGEAGAAGRDGKDGIDGKDGYTPVKGVDYWTETDLAEITSEIEDLIDQYIISTLNTEVII